MVYQVVIMRGIPGSGKSTYVAKNHPGAYICSADHFFIDQDGTYRYDSSRRSDAHGQCLRKFVAAIQRGEATIVVDNTNTTVMEIAPYAALALAYKYDLQIVSIECKPEVGVVRNVHSVPTSVVEQMYQNFLDHSKMLPPWWPIRTVAIV